MICTQGFAPELRCATEAWVWTEFGERVIFADEVGFSNVKLPFSEKLLKGDRLSWIISHEENGVAQYDRYQALYTPNPFEKYDTVSLKEALEIIRVVKKAKRQFPDSEKVKFFLTKDKFISSEGQKYLRAICCNGNDVSVVNLPANARSVSLGGSMYLVGMNDSKDEIVLGAGKPGTDDEFGKVMTLVRLTSK